MDFPLPEIDVLRHFRFNWKLCCGLCYGGGCNTFGNAIIKSKYREASVHFYSTRQ